MSGGKRLVVLVAALLAVGTLGACGDDDENEDAATATTAATEEPSQATPTKVSVTAKDYSFDVPATLKGGLIEISYVNSGKEPHFASFARIARGKTIDDVKAALTAPPSAAPPSGRPPFEEVIALPTADPGGTGNMTGNLPAGKYALYCVIPSPDGVSHAAKGMITEVTVSQGTDGELPESIGTVTAVDFGLAPMPPVKAGTNVIRLSNKGKQLHELGFVELAPGKKIEDVVAWFNQESGPPPMSFRSGVAVKPGLDATTEVELEKGSAYAFICAIPDVLGDFKAHITKGMYTSSFTVS